MTEQTNKEFSSSCSNGHEEIGFSSAQCPLCEALVDLGGMTRNANRLYEICKEKDAKVEEIERRLGHLKLIQRQ